MIEPASHRFRSHGLDLHYLAWGNEGAPPLLLIHGGRDNAASWNEIAPHFADRWRVIAPDLRGHGESAWVNDGQYDIWDHVLDLHALAEHLGAEPLTIVAHSLGGNIATRFTGLYPERVRRLVSIEGLGPAPALIAAREDRDFTERLREWVAARAKASARRARVYPDIESAVPRLQAVNPHLTDEKALRLAQGGMRAVPGGFVFAYDPAIAVWDSAADVTTAERHALWARIACPVLLIYGAESWASNPAEDGRAAHFRDARVELLAGAGHWVQHDRQDEVIRLLNDFL
jgi:pimeloyl-ACP methyl ester carboxylesterase